MFLQEKAVAAALAKKRSSQELWQERRSSQVLWHRRWSEAKRSGKKAV